MWNIFAAKLENVREILGSSASYYIIVPIVLAIWPVWVAFVSLPSAAANWNKEQSQYVKAQKVITKILDIDPERLQLTGLDSKTGKFNYATAVDHVAKICGIKAENYKLTSSVPTKTRGQQTQTAYVTLKTVNIEKFAGFLSIIELRWANLQCTRLKLTRQKGLPDLWKGEVRFKYYH